MKKIIIAILSLFMIMSFTTVVSAGTSSQNGTTKIVTITGTSGTCPGPGLTFNPSPSTLISAMTSIDNCTIISTSSKTTGGAGIDYGIDSDANGIYQRPQGTDKTLTVTGQTALILPTSFRDKANNAPPTS